MATVHALQPHAREADGRDLHATCRLASRSRTGSTSPRRKLQRVYDAGYAAGVQATENRQHGVDDFLGTDGKPTWEAVALFLQRNKHRLAPRHHEFIDDMAARTAWGHEPTERQHKYLHSLFFKLGGKIT